MLRGRRRQAWVAIGASAVALLMVWRLLPAASPPLYDGICIADPYRHLGGNPAPTSATSSFPGAQFPAAEVLTSETPAQAQVLMMAGTFSAASSISVTVQPVAPPAPPPPGKTQDGNAYQITATSGGQQVQPSSSDPATIVLRGSGASGSLVLYVDPGGGWQPLKTFNLGCGFTFEAVSPKLGYFALFRSAGSAGTSSSGGGFPIGIVIAILGALIVLATIVLARFAAARRR
ncbi:MAG: hypothetical protein JOZ75_05470 [Candidatus Dormibacteraeota bacterium]|nr:hypothetical protein [Candidatus Dormibacteraeota bacterium]